MKQTDRNSCPQDIQWQRVIERQTTHKINKQIVSKLRRVCCYRESKVGKSDQRCWEEVGVSLTVCTKAK